MSTGALKSVTDPKGNKTEYTRVSTSDDRLKKVTAGGTAVSYNYSGTRLQSILFGNEDYGENYSFTYDNFGNTISTKVGNTALSTNTYSGNNGVLSKVTYANGDSQGYTYTKEGFLKSTALTPAGGTAKTASVLTYDSTGRVATLSDKLSNRRTYYTYDSLSRSVRTTLANDTNGTHYGHAEYRYDVRGNVTRYGVEVGGKTANSYYHYTKLKDSEGNVQGYTADYEKGNLLTRFRMYPDRYTDYSYDRLDRLSQAAFYNDGRTIYKSYYYYERTNQPETGVKYKSSQISAEYIDNTAYRFTYDDLGNITSVKTAARTNPDTNNTAIGELSDYRSYEYDGKSQLTRENNATTNKTTVWTYDTLGNITSKAVYPYTIGALGTAEQTVNYTYSNDGKSGWNHLLTGVGNDTITYDEIGNPTQYLGASLTWFGRKLQRYEKGDKTVSYTYDANGMRASKTVNGVKTEYLYLDGALRYEKRGINELYYVYDANGYLGNIKWYQNGEIKLNIYVLTNAQGDVVGLYDYKGELQVSYEYDAWGNLVNVTDITSGNWSKLNPFRYRGYYYDEDTGLYYLGSRYYDPEVGRFLNADGYISTGQDITGFNMFTYCGNNPVMRYDPTGTFWITALIATAVIAVCTLAFSGCTKQPKSDVGSAKPYVKMSGNNNSNSPNCYAYAIGSSVNEQPGGASGRTPTLWNDVNDVGASVKADLKTKGYTVREISGPNEKVYENEFKIALRVGTKPCGINPYSGQLIYDYHFMRQTNTGQWAEKHGYGGDSICWDAGMTPDTIPWTLNGKPYYDSDIIYYAVGM